jgi:hypothetical protein
MAKIYLNKSVSLELGPQASFLLSERNNFDVRDANTFDFAANAGFKNHKSFFIEGRYSLGLTDVSTNAQELSSSAGFLF